MYKEELLGFTVGKLSFSIDKGSLIPCVLDIRLGAKIMHYSIEIFSIQIYHYSMSLFFWR